MATPASDTYKKCFDITSVSSGDLITPIDVAADPTILIDKLIFPKLSAFNGTVNMPGLVYLSIRMFVIAPIVSLANPKLRIYFQDDLINEALGEETWLPGDPIELESGDETPIGETKGYMIQPIYTGNCKIALALEECENGTRIIIVGRKQASERISSNA